MSRKRKDVLQETTCSQCGQVFLDTPTHIARWYRCSYCRATPLPDAADRLAVLDQIIKKDPIHSAKEWQTIRETIRQDLL